jgi:RimJ/RimL family protein N-acetyltransferase
VTLALVGVDPHSHGTIVRPDRGDADGTAAYAARVPALLPFSTPRLVLRPFTLDDAAAFAAYRSDPDVARYQSWQAPYPLALAKAFIASLAGIDGPVAGDWVQIAVEHDGALAGDVAVGLSKDGLIATIGYTLAPARQGRGLAVEAVDAVVDRLFADLGVHRVEASVDPRNVASARLVESLGFELEGTARAAVADRDGWADDAHYALTAAGHAAWAARPLGPPDVVRLVEITPATARAMLELRTHPTQRRFVSTVAESFADALFPDVINGAPVLPWMRAIEADGERVGFVMLAERTEQHPEPYLWRLLVDRRHQRRGIGDRALTVLVDELRSAGHTSLLVEWRLGPGSPEPFYLRRGFVKVRAVSEDEVEARLTL